jgi:Domain of unknown function (DUF4157)
MFHSAPTKNLAPQRQHVAERSSSEPARDFESVGPCAEILALQPTIGNRAVVQLLRAEMFQTKLAVSQPGDVYEQEADRVADQVMRMSETDGPLGIATSPWTPPPSIQRLCGECEEELHKRSSKNSKREVQTKEMSGTLPGSAEVLQTEIDALRGGGQPLPGPTRAFFEERFDYDFSRVRMHTEGKAASLAHAVNARAFTTGNNIVFGPQQYSPETAVGRRLLAHELTHVLQQTGRTQSPNTRGVSGSNSALGRMANESVSSTSQGTMIQRQDIGSYLGLKWLGLPRIAKAPLVDTVIAFALRNVDEFPGRVVVGELWLFIREGLIGFFEKLKSSAEDLKITAMDKVATIFAGKDEAFLLAFLKGILKGFFIEGALGIFSAIGELIKGLGKVWDFIKGIGEAIAGFPDEIQTLIEGFRSVGEELVANVGPAIEEVKKLVTDPKGASSFAATIVEKGKAFAKRGGEGIADSFLSFFSKQEAGAEIGEAVGSVTGQILWEVVFAAVTAGAGAAVTAAKSTIKGAVTVLGKIVGKVVGAILKVVEEIRVVFGKVVEFVKGAIKFVKGKLSEVGGRFAKLLEDVGEFFAKLLRNCHESKLVCNLPRGGGKKLSKVAPDIEAAVEKGIVEEATATTQPVRRPRPARATTTGRGAAARGNFDKLRDGYAKQLGVESGGQVHHGIELQTLDKYPGVLTEKELNAFENMRGIGTEQANKRQLHNSKIREVWDRHYRRIDEEISARKLQPGTKDYSDFVRRNLVDGRNELDHVLGQFFTEYRTGRPRSFQ